MITGDAIFAQREICRYVTTAPGFIRRSIAYLLEEGGDGRKGRGRMGLSALSTAVAAAVTGAAAILCYGWRGANAVFADFGEIVLIAFESAARLLGAVA